MGNLSKTAWQKGMGSPIAIAASYGAWVNRNPCLECRRILWAAPKTKTGHLLIYKLRDQRHLRKCGVDFEGDATHD